MVTPLGAARRRPGSRYIANTVADHPAALFPYTDLEGTRYIVQISAQDGVDPIAYQYLTVLSGITPNSQNPTTLPSYLDFAGGVVEDDFWDTTTDPNTNGSEPGTIPVGSGLTSSNCYFTPYTESQLDGLTSFQHEGKLFILHADHPPNVLERFVLPDGTEEWSWTHYKGEDARQSMEVLKRSARITMSISGTTVTASENFFSEDNANGSGYIWRIGGEDTASVTHPWGCWYEQGQYTSSTKMTVSANFAGTTPINDVTDWAGPWIVSADVSSGQKAASQAQYAIATWTLAGADLDTGMVGAIFHTSGGAADGYYIVTRVITTTTCSAVRLESGTETTNGSNMNMTWAYLGGNSVPERLGHPIMVYQGMFSEGHMTEVVPQGYQTLLGPDSATKHTLEGSQEVGGQVFMGAGWGGLEDPMDSLIGTPTKRTAYSADTVTYRVHKRPYPTQGYSVGWSKEVGFPTAGASFQGRVWLGGFSGTAGDVIVASGTNNAKDFAQSADDDGGLNFKIQVASTERIKWIVPSAADLLIGTDCGEYRMTGAPITPSNIGVDRQTGYGAQTASPIFVSGAALFVERGGTGIRQVEFSFDRDRYLASDITDIASHLFVESNKIVQLSSANSPHSMVFARTDKNKLYACTFRRENNILAWSPWTFSWHDDAAGYGGVEWIATMPAWSGDDPDVSGESMGEHDNLFCVVVSPNSTRMIVAIGEPYIHDAQSYATSQSTTELLNMDQFTSMSSVRVIADDVDIGAFSVDSSGNLDWSSVGYTGGTLPTTTKAGFGINFEVIPTIPYAPQRDGASQGRLQSVMSLRVLLLGTRGVIVEGDAHQPVPSAIVTEATDEEINGWVELDVIGEHGDNNEISISQTASYYIEIGGINFGADYSG
jgi:hypothetical protein